MANDKENKPVKKETEKPIVYVGEKKISSYVLAGSIQLNKGTEVVIKARGKNISRAVDVAELLKKNFAPNLEIVETVTGTEPFVVDGKTKGVSTISLKLRKK